MERMSLDQRVQAFMRVPRIGVVGVSAGDRGHQAGNAIYRRLKSQGRTAVPIHPVLDAFDGDPCAPDLKAAQVGAVVLVTRPDLTEELVRQCPDAGIGWVWMHASGAQGSSVSAEAVAFCQAHGVNVIAGACPMMFGPGADFGHRCMKLMLRLSGGLPR